MKIKAFCALRPAAERASVLASVPYDVVDTREAARLAEGNCDSFLHVARPEIDLPEGTDIYSDAVYAQGVKNFKALQERSVLGYDDGEHVYLYRQIMNGHAQIGLVCCCSIDDYAGNVIRRHEKTRKDKEDDRTRHTYELRANTGPVFLTYRATDTIERLVGETVSKEPLYDFVAVDGIQHTVWRVDGDGEAFVRAFAEVPVSYVADGHHRAASAYRVGTLCRSQKPDYDGSEEFNWFLAVLFPAEQLRILPYNRCVADLNGMDAEAFLAKVKTIFKVEETGSATPVAGRSASMYLAGKWYSLGWDVPEDEDVVGKLDVSVLQNRLLAPVLGIADPRTDTRISFIGGIRGTGELEQRVNEGRDAVAFSMYPVTVDEMMDIADADAIMPPKSTWFEPKLRSGLLIHTF